MGYHRVVGDPPIVLFLAKCPEGIDCTAAVLPDLGSQQSRAPAALGPRISHAKRAID